MPLDAWLPNGFRLPEGQITRLALFDGPQWQLIATEREGRALIVSDALALRWMESGLIDSGTFRSFRFGSRMLWALTSGPDHTLSPLTECASPNTASECMAFALSMKETRRCDGTSPLQDAIYAERISRLLPTYSISSRTDDAAVLGYWLTGGAGVSTSSSRRLSHMLSWLSSRQLNAIIAAAGLAQGAETHAPSHTENDAEHTLSPEGRSTRPADADTTPLASTFELPGRPQLAAFINEHIVDIVRNRERYQALGIGFPAAFVLHGPPGCGKTFAVEKLIEFLGWPSFHIDSGSVGSPYIHETSRKVSDLFEQAMRNAPSVLVIDEMEAFLADRNIGAGHHHVEEVAEFLRRIPEATKRDVLVIAMTNRLDMIDPAVLRRGRFDHTLSIGFAEEQEVLSLLHHLLASIPTAEDVDPRPIAAQLAGKPLSDAAFVIREGARIAAQAGKQRLDQSSLLAALTRSPQPNKGASPPRPVGFI